MPERLGVADCRDPAARVVFLEKRRQAVQRAVPDRDLVGNVLSRRLHRNPLHQVRGVGPGNVVSTETVEAPG